MKVRRRTAALVTSGALVAAVAVFTTETADAAVYDVPSSITSNCTVDVTAALQTWIDSVPDGNTARLALGGCYKTEGPILLRNRTNLTVDGNGATVQAFTDGAGFAPPDPYFAHRWPRKRTRFTVDGGSGVTVTNIVLRGGNPHAGLGDAAYNPDLEAQHAVEFINTTDGTFTDSEAYDMWGDFAYVAGSTGVTVDGNFFRRNGRQGVAVASGADIWVTGNDISDVRRTVFDIEANVDSAVIDNVHIEGNVTGVSRLGWFSNGGQSWHISNIHVKDNVMTGTSGLPTVNVDSKEPDGDRGPYFVEGNTLMIGGSPRPAIYFRNVTGVTVTGNELVFPYWRGDMTGIWFTNVPLGSATGNTFTGAHAADVVTECTC